MGEVQTTYAEIVFVVDHLAHPQIYCEFNVS
jgi:hypothetical protein